MVYYQKIYKIVINIKIYLLSWNSCEVISDMGKDVECKKCEYAEDLKGCAAKHVGEARKLIAEGEVEGADLQLS